jgi:hypothetical protein
MRLRDAFPARAAVFYAARYSSIRKPTLMVTCQCMTLSP